MDAPAQFETQRNGRTSIFAIIVLYNKLAASSPTIKTLLEAAHAASNRLRLTVLIVDNTPGGQDPGILPEGVRYYAEPDNPGLAVPYNKALKMAEEEGFTWLLTLDQDTNLPVDFLKKIEVYAEEYVSDARVAGIVPRIADRGRLISPFRFVGGFFPKVLAPGVEGVSKRFTSALNSASMLRVSAVRMLGGYDLQFPLHNSDTNLFHRLDLAGKRLIVAGNILVNHELAIMDRQGRMTPERYRRLLADERAFWDFHMGVLGRAERLLRLVGRMCKDTLRDENRDFRAITLNEIKLRLLTRRSNRIRRWTEAR
ncbi:glycosyltransferase [Tunturiibacter empetritectus]|uniref:GT2 family glycosyltransferase n=2 Tax=Tunturiibacter TaxID=3154218 RepID=A0A852VPD8_9BACT|nr:glycosyltransferase [Edaphobacter lichenicola]NYF91232.1 GT2 family glycosyltransferase [Edaphobacter lichenicola]